MVGDIMLMLHEILGTDKPVFKEKQAEHFFYQELLALNEKPSQYKITGYVKVRKNKQLFFKRVYS
ncbi:hypothetical protein DL988_19965 [Shigella flexneri]|nr:hypothetical protein [Shigella flexneri]